MKNYSGLTIQQYHITQQLGHGGMAAVYKAYDTHLDRDVAIKMIRMDEVPPDQADLVRERFKSEASLQMRFQHANIVPVYDFGEVDGIPYLVMAYLPGGTLKERMRSPLSLKSAVRILAPVVDALAYTHSLGVIHRDIKPSNILFNAQRMPVLTDFGIARVLEPEREQPGMLAVGVGTPAYMAPEQWRGVTLPQTDIYAIGVVLYEIVTGVRPYTADTPIAVALKQTGEPIPDPRQFVPGLPAQVEHFLYKAMAKDVENRYASMAELKAALLRLASLDFMPAAPISYPAPSRQQPAPQNKPPQAVRPVLYEPSEDGRSGTLVYDLDEMPDTSVDQQPQKMRQEPPARYQAEQEAAYADQPVPEMLAPSGNQQSQPFMSSTQVEGAESAAQPVYYQPDEYSDVESQLNIPSRENEKRPVQRKPRSRGSAAETEPQNFHSELRYPPPAQPNALPAAVRFTWAHVFILALVWGCAHLLKVLITLLLENVLGLDIAYLLGTVSGWAIGGLALGLVFKQAALLKEDYANLAAPLLGFSGGISVVMRYVINSETNTIFESAVLWGLAGLVIGIVFSKAARLTEGKIALLSLGWLLAGALSSLPGFFQVQDRLVNELGTVAGFLVAGLLEGVTLGLVLGCTAGMVFARVLSFEINQVILLGLGWAGAFGIGHAVYQMVANGFGFYLPAAAMLDWFVRIGLAFLVLKLLYFKETKQVVRYR